MSRKPILHPVFERITFAQKRKNREILMKLTIAHDCSESQKINTYFNGVEIVHTNLD
jgi:hypothetical protein